MIGEWGWVRVGVEGGWGGWGWREGVWESVDEGETVTRGVGEE